MEKKSNLLIESLKLQQEIFGNELFLNDMDKKTSEPFGMNSPAEEETLFVANEFETAKSLDELEKMICDCMECPLGQTRNKLVFGKGNPNAKVMCIGEGPGAEEDAKGEPFVGRAGQLLTDILKAIKFSREEIYIANIVKCRPPGNRTPSPDEIDRKSVV